MTISKVLNLVTGEYIPSLLVGSDFVCVGGIAPPPPDGGEITVEKLSYDLPEILALITPAPFIIPSVSELSPSQVDEATVAFLIIDNTNSPVPTVSVNINVDVDTEAELPLISELGSGVIILVGDTLPEQSSLVYIQANFNMFANSVFSNTNWQNPTDVLQDNTGTAATLTVASSGIGGTTDESISGDIILDFRQVQLGDLSIFGSITLNVETSHEIGSIAINQPTTDLEYQYSLDGLTYTTFHSEVISAAKAVNTIDLTSLVNQGNLDDLRVRAVGNLTSGTGLNVTSTISFYRVWFSYAAAKEYVT